METQCKLCNGTGWLSIRVDPVPPWSDFMSVDHDAEGCWVCNPGGSTSDYFRLSDEIQEQIPYYFATAVGGFDGTYGMLQGYDSEGNGTHTYIFDRSMANYGSWTPRLPIEDCPVCLGWGIWSNNGHIYDCIACGGYPIESRQGFEPLHAWWVNWKLGHRTLFTQRGNPDLEAIAESRRDHPHIGDCLVYTLEEMPGMVRVQ